MQKREISGIGSVAVSVLGWTGIGLVAALFPGGHPPLLAYIFVPIVVGLIPVNVLGLILCRSIRPESGWVKRLVCWGSLLFLTIGLAVVLYAIIIPLAD